MGETHGLLNKAGETVQMKTNRLMAASLWLWVACTCAAWAWPAPAQKQGLSDADRAEAARKFEAWQATQRNESAPFTAPAREVRPVAPIAKPAPMAPKQVEPSTPPPAKPVVKPVKKNVEKPALEKKPPKTRMAPERRPVHLQDDWDAPMAF